MLIVGDIHMTGRQQDDVLTTLQEFVAAHPDEQHILFLGDYVYHFSYERKALLALFGFFVELYKQGKSVWILAGNHDWIQEHFVFTEGKRSFDLLGQDASGGKITFITEPLQTTIEGQDILFFPFTQLPENDYETEMFANLLTDPHHHVQQSGRANNRLHELVEAWRKDAASNQKLLVAHHRYIANTVFPGQRTRFSYKSPALAKSWMEQDDLLLLSGHLHQPFCHQNYLCTGSIWSTSPLEIDQVKYLFVRKEGKVYAEPVAINPYISVPYTGEKVTKEQLDQRWRGIQKKALEHMDSPHRNVVPHTTDGSVPLKQTTLYLHGEKLEYSQLQEVVPDELRYQLKDIKIRQSQQAMETLLSSLEDSSLQLDERISDWKTLLKRYLAAKFGEDADAYETMLDELQIW